MSEQVLVTKRHDAATDWRWCSRLPGPDASLVNMSFLFVPSYYVIRDGLCVWACSAWNVVMECDRPVLPERRHLAPRQWNRVCNHLLNGSHRPILSTHRTPNMRSMFLHLHQLLAQSKYNHPQIPLSDTTLASYFHI